MQPAYGESPEFRKLVEGQAGVDLTRIALEISRDADPAVDPDAYLARIDELSERVRDRCPRGCRPAHILGQINWVLYVEEGFQGNTDDYNDPRNSYMHEVIQRKMGIPISLCLLYRAIAGRLGLDLGGVNLPSHFMLRTGETDPFFIDAFNGGTLLDRDACERKIGQVTGRKVVLTADLIQPASPRSIVRRLLRNLKYQLMSQGDYQSVLPVTRRLVALDRENASEQRDFGLACYHTDRPAEAVEAFRIYLMSEPEAEEAQEIRELIKRFMREVAERN